MTDAKERARELYSTAYNRWCYELSHDKNVAIARDIGLFICVEMLKANLDREFWEEVKAALKNDAHNQLYKGS
jgi:hypothetical protein